MVSNKVEYSILCIAGISFLGYNFDGISCVHHTVYPSIFTQQCFLIAPNNEQSKLKSTWLCMIFKHNTGQKI